MKYFLVLPLMWTISFGFSQECFTGSIVVTATPSTVNNQVVLTWNPVSDNGGWDEYSDIFYTVHYGVGNLGTTLLPSTQGTSVTVNNLTLGASYSFRIHVTQTCGLTDGSNRVGQDVDRAASNIAAATLIPDIPTLSSGTPSSANSINIAWNAVTGASSYDFEVTNTNAAGGIVETGNSTSTSKVIAGLSPNTNYFYRVRAKNATGTSINFSPKSGAILTFPAAPTFPAIAASAITTTSFKVNWNATPGASSYRLEVSADPNFISFVTNPATLVINGTISPDILGLTGATTYYYRVRAVNNLGGTSVNSVRNQVLTAPLIPIGFSVSSTTSNTTTVNWATTATATAYELFVSTDQNFNIPLAAYNPKIINAPTLSEVVSGLSPSTTYYLKLRAKNGTNSYSGYTSPLPVSTLLAPIQPPTFPVVSATSITTTSFQATWNSVSGANFYQLDVSNDSDFNSLIVNNQTVNSTSSSVNNLAGGTIYYYRVRAVNGNGIPSENSLRKEVLTSPITPTGLSVNAITSASMNINWVTAPTATHYELMVASDQNFNSPIAGYNPKMINDPTISEQVTGLSASTTYYIRLRAKNGTNSYSGYTLPLPVSTLVALIQPPTFPVVSATFITTTSFQATWNSVSGANFYQLDVSNDSDFNSLIVNNQTVNSTSSFVNNLAGGTIYYYRVRAVNGNGIPSENSLRKEVLTSPTTPTGLSVNAITSTSMNISWVTTPTATHYELTVASDQNFNSPVAGYNPKIISDPTISEQVTGLSASTTYYIRLRAKNGTNSYSGYTLPLPVSTLVAPIQPPTFPVISATSITTTSFQATWNSVSGANFYQLDVSNDSDFNSLIVNNQTVNSTSSSVNNLTGGTIYYYRVRAVNGNGIPSENSVRKEVLTSPITPTGLSVNAITSTSMNISWVTTPTATHYELTVASDQNFNSPVAGYNPKIISDPIISEPVTGLSASTTYYIRLRAKNNGDSYSPYAFTSSSTRAFGEGIGMEIGPPFFPSTHSTAEVQTISVEIVNANPPVAVLLYHRKNSELSYEEETIPLANGNTYQISINDEWLDKFGMEFYITSSDINNPKIEKKDLGGEPFKILRSISDVTTPQLSFGTEVKDYQIISFPYLIKDRLQVQDVFEQVMGSYDRKKWRLFQYKDGQTVEYSAGVNASTIEQGQAYWFISKEEKILSFGEGQTYGNSLSKPFTLKLKRGWNQIGNPFPYDLNWADVQLLNPLVGTLNIFDKTAVSFAESNLLKVFSGGFVFAENPLDVIFPVTLARKDGRRATNPANDNFDGNAWSLPIQVVQGEVVNTSTGIGMRPGALDGKDKFDKVTAPRFLRYVELNSKKLDYEFDLSTDVVARNDNYKWNFFLESNSSELVELKWSKQVVATLDAHVILYDHAKHVLIDMAKLDAYTTLPSTNISIHFSRSGLGLQNSDQVELGKPYPNPFQTEVTLPYNYNYSREEPIQAEFIVYDVTGKEVVQKYINTTSDQPGIQSIKWDGMTQSGNQAASGMYLFKMKVDSGNGVINFNGRIFKK